MGVTRRGVSDITNAIIENSSRIRVLEGLEEDDAQFISTSFALNIPITAPSTSYTMTFAVPLANFGDPVVLAHNDPSNNDWIMFGNVNATGVVKLIAFNASGMPLSLNATLNVVVIKV